MRGTCGNTHKHKSINQVPLRSNMGIREPNQKHQQILITNQYIKVIMVSNIKNKER